MNTDDLEMKELEKEFTWYRVVYYNSHFSWSLRKCSENLRPAKGRSEQATIQFDEDKSKKRAVPPEGTTTINGAKKSVNCPK